MAVLRPFRATDAFRSRVLDVLSLAGNEILDLGNLYTAAMPAWLAAGFEEALAGDRELDGLELLTLGYGSGDAAEVIPFRVAPGWREATARIRFAEAMAGPVDLDRGQYEDLHDGRAVRGLDYRPSDEFVIDRVGTAEDRQFQVYGIEYYRYAG